MNEKAEKAEIVEDAEIVDETEKNAAPLATMPGERSIYQSTDPQQQLEEAQARARVLVKVVEDQGLAKSFREGSRPHVFVEGWQFLASQFGLIPDIEWTRELDNGAGWEARAALTRIGDGQVIAHADAECRTSESNWKNRDSYAVRSMAQTRAVSKVCRVALSSVMVMAGFNATPAEEMDGIVGGGGSYTPPNPYGPDEEGPATPDDPHCPACLKEHGTLVAVTGPHDRKPYWRCTADPRDCGGFRTYQGKEYSWSGWHKTFENSVADYEGRVISDEPETKTVETGRQNHTGYMVNEIMGLTGATSEVDAKVLIKPALIAAIERGDVDAAEALGGTPSDPPTEDELRVIVTRLTSAEADWVISAAAKISSEKEE